MTRWGSHRSLRRRTALALGGVALAATAAALPLSPLAPAAQANTPVATHLHTEPNVLDVQSDTYPHATYWFPGLTAVLTESASGAPVAGRLVYFVANQAIVCTATTDARGEARCAGDVDKELGVIADLGYEAYFLGDDTYAASSSHSGLVTVDDNDLF